MIWSSMLILMYSSGIKCFLIFAGIPGVFLECFCEVVSSREIFTCAHIQIFVWSAVKYSVYGGS